MVDFDDPFPSKGQESVGNSYSYNLSVVYIEITRKARIILGIN